MHNIPQQSVLFPELFDKPIYAEFCQDRLSSQGGGILLKAIDHKLRLTQKIAETFIDHRLPNRVRHQIVELTRQRIFSLALGYPDCNDADHLNQDPLLKMLCERDPIQGEALGSQPTLSRLENSVTRTQLLKLSYRLTEIVLTQQRKRRRGQRCPSRVIIDLDPTCDPTHGQQQLTLFNGFYDTWCYLPLVVTISFGRERRKYPVAIILRPGTASAMNGTLAVLKRLIRLLRAYFPTAQLYFRADAAFCNAKLLNYLEREEIRYAISIASNPRLKSISLGWMDLVRQMTHIHGKSVTIHREDLYRAKKWSRARRLAYKAEVLVQGSDHRDNDRYLMTTLPGNFSPTGVFHFYYGHSDMENILKEFKADLDLGGTSCSRFLANQLRVLWSLAAYILMQVLQEGIVDKELSRATMGTLRERLLKIAVRVKETTRKINLYFTSHYPFAQNWIELAKSVGAVPV